jgi:hypothetical protein
MKRAYQQAIYRHNYRVVDQFFQWLDRKARRSFVRSVGPIVASCGNSECPVCRERNVLGVDARAALDIGRILPYTLQEYERCNHSHN